jgi:hypothetical protein
MLSNMIDALGPKRCKAGFVGLLVDSSSVVDATLASVDTYKLKCLPSNVGIELCVSYDWTDDGYVSVEEYSNNDPAFLPLR